jgi:type I restriction enzyme S subunit
VIFARFFHQSPALCLVPGGNKRMKSHAWEQRKLSDGMTEYTDRVFIEDDQIYRQVTVKNTGEISLRGSQPGRNIGRKRQARVNLRDYPMTLIFTRQTVEQGGIGFAKNDVDGCIVTENMPTIAVDGKKFNQDFLVAFFKTYGFRKDVILSNIEGGTAQIAIHEDDILDSSSTFPSLKEQIKIGNFFRTLSQQITLHQRQSAGSNLPG